jgi:hypothetical protein
MRLELLSLLLCFLLLFNFFAYYNSLLLYPLLIELESIELFVEVVIFVTDFLLRPIGVKLEEILLSM